MGNCWQMPNKNGRSCSKCQEKKKKEKNIQMGVNEDVGTAHWHLVRFIIYLCRFDFRRCRFLSPPSVRLPVVEKIVFD